MAAKPPCSTTRSSTSSGPAPPQHAAAGLPAVAESLRIARRQMGVTRTALTLLKVNQ